MNPLPLKFREVLHKTPYPVRFLNALSNSYILRLVATNATDFQPTFRLGIECYGIFEGGEAKGLAHVGALRACEDRKIHFKGVAGTSAGAIIVGLIAVGYRAQELFSPEATNDSPVFDKDYISLIGRHEWEWDLAQAARSPGSAATRANRAATAAAEPEATEPATTATTAAAATSAATEPETAATTAAAAPAATSATTTSAGFLHAAANVFLIEDIERGETDVGHFLVAKNEALIGRGIVRLRDAGSGHRGCGCTTHQRKT
jgi:hypothetical protein